MPFTPHRQLRNARTLRHDETSAEALLWSRLRSRRLNGLKFIRQAPIGPYIADFLCREARLVVEIDGATHSQDQEVAYDERRTAVIAAEGYRTLRIQNDDVFHRIGGVLDTIVAAIEGSAGRDDRAACAAQPSSALRAPRQPRPPCTRSSP